jgi:hypothetical protein
LANDKGLFHVDGVHYWHGHEFLLLAAIASERCKPGEFSLEAKTAQVMSAIAAEAFIDQVATSLAGGGEILDRVSVASGKAVCGWRRALSKFSDADYP